MILKKNVVVFTLISSIVFPWYNAWSLDSHKSAVGRQYNMFLMWIIIKKLQQTPRTSNSKAMKTTVQ